MQIPACADTTSAHLRIATRGKEVAHLHVNQPEHQRRKFSRSGGYAVIHSCVHREHMGSTAGHRSHRLPTKLQPAGLCRAGTVVCKGQRQQHSSRRQQGRSHWSPPPHWSSAAPWCCSSRWSSGHWSKLRTPVRTGHCVFEAMHGSVSLVVCKLETTTGDSRHPGIYLHVWQVSSDDNDSRPREPVPEQGAALTAS